MRQVQGYLAHKKPAGKHLEVIPVRLFEALRLRQLGARGVQVLEVLRVAEHVAFVPRPPRDNQVDGPREEAVQKCLQGGGGLSGGSKEEGDTGATRVTSEPRGRGGGWMGRESQRRGGRVLACSGAAPVPAEGLQGCGAVGRTLLWLGWGGMRQRQGRGADLVAF